MQPGPIGEPALVVKTAEASASGRANHGTLQLGINRNQADKADPNSLPERRVRLFGVAYFLVTAVLDPLQAFFAPRFIRVFRLENQRIKQVFIMLIKTLLKILGKLRVINQQSNFGVNHHRAGVKVH